MRREHRLLGLALAVSLAACDTPTEAPISETGQRIFLSADGGRTVLADGTVIGTAGSGIADGVVTSLARTTLGSDDVVLPAIARDAMLGANNVIPHSWGNFRYQQVFLGSEVGGAGAFGALCLRPDDVFTSGALEQDMTVKLGPTQHDPGSIGVNFDGNYSASPVTVFTGTFRMPATGPGGVDDWIACMDFDRPYNHPGGALIVEIINSSPESDAIWIADKCNPPPFGGGEEGCHSTRVYARDSNASAATAIGRNQGLAIRLVAITAVERVEQLTTSVEDLEDREALNRGQASSLRAKLTTALERVDVGRTNAAVNLLGAFVNQVSDLIDTGVLTPAEGQPLIDEAVSIIAQLS